MSYALRIGLAYLRSKKRSTISVITVVAVGGVALGVAALLAVLSITSGFQDEFRNKVLGVNSHVLVLKYGLDFDEYRDVIATALEMPEVAGAGPFVINEMMLAKGDRLSGILVKGVDPEAMATVLDLPSQMVEGSLDGLRAEGAQPPLSPDQLAAGEGGGDRDLDEFLQELTDDDDPTTDELSDEDEALRERIAETGGREPLFADAGPGGDRDAAAEWTPIWEEEGEGPAQLAQESQDSQDPDAIERLPDVQVPTPEQMEEALAELDEGDLPTDDFERDLFEEEEAQREPAVPAEDLPGVVVGKTLAENLGLEVGDRVRIISPLAGLDTSMWSPNARTPRSKEFRVLGVFEAGFQEYDSRLVYVDLYEAQSFFDQGDTVTGVEIRLHDLEKAPAISSRLERQLGGGPFHTMDWEELNHNLFTALEIQKVVLSLVFTTIMVVASFMVVATLIMVVLHKKREIAILKAMGAKDSAILGIFMVQGTVIGLVGTLLGLLVGGGAVAYLAIYQFPLDPKVYLIDHLPVRVSPMEFVLTVGIALLICMSATLIPSWWAARLLPADGVRYE